MFFCQTLAEIHRIMLEDAVTKEVFREMDGFLVLIGVLSTLHATPTESDKRTQDVLEGTRLSALIVSDATRSHKENAVYFQVSVYSSYKSWSMTDALIDAGWLRLSWRGRTSAPA
jgi:hypothetical protein